MSETYQLAAERAVIDDLERVDNLLAEIAELKRENQRLTNELAQYRIVAADLREQFDTLHADARDLANAAIKSGDYAETRRAASLFRGLHPSMQ